MADEVGESSESRRRLYRDALSAGWASLASVAVPLILLMVVRGEEAWGTGMVVVVTLVGGPLLLLAALLNASLTVVLAWRLRRAGHPSFWKPLILAIPGVIVSSAITLSLLVPAVREGLFL